MKLIDFLLLRTFDKDFTVLPVGESIAMKINKLRRNDLFSGLLDRFK